MPKEMTPTELRRNLFRVLDEILASGKPLDIKRKGHKLRITPLKSASGVRNLDPHPGTIVGEPEDIVHCDWSSHWNPEAS